MGLERTKPMQRWLVTRGSSGVTGMGKQGDCELHVSLQNLPSLNLWFMCSKQYNRRGRYYRHIILVFYTVKVYSCGIKYNKMLMVYNTVVVVYK